MIALSLPSTLLRMFQVPAMSASETVAGAASVAGTSPTMASAGLSAGFPHAAERKCVSREVPRR